MEPDFTLTAHRPEAACHIRVLAEQDFPKYFMNSAVIGLRGAAYMLIGLPVVVWVPHAGQDVARQAGAAHGQIDPA